jgi:hypothetical protein
MIFMGDTHGSWDTYRHIINKMQHKGGRVGAECSLQLGDMGIGFDPHKHNPDDVKDYISYIKPMSKEHQFIRGNHDDPAFCKIHPNYIGDFGFLPKPNIFFFGGGFSIDYKWRTQDMNWWKDEELSEEEMADALDLYKESKPKIMVSHECPLGVKIDFVTNKWKLDVDSRTEKILHSMLEIHQPEYWIFGHHHQRKEIDKNGTHFVCLHELIDGPINDCIYEIPNLTWEGYK